MPLVHIHVTESRRTPAQLTLLADSIQHVMREYFDAPDRDRYQIITEHKRGQIIAGDCGSNGVSGLTR